MNPIEALHTAARRYCIERIALWRRAYYDLLRQDRHLDRHVSGPAESSAEALNTFPRYVLLEDLLVEIESFAPEDFESINDARELMAVAAETASPSALRKGGKLETAAADEEKQSFATWVRSVGADRLANVAPLTYRHVLSRGETLRLAALFRTRWGKWYGGVCDGPSALTNLTLYAPWFTSNDKLDRLRALFRRQDIRRVIELREWGPCAELDLDLTDFSYNGAEGYWTAGTMDWMVYASHEASITLGGEWLIAEWKHAFPDWQTWVYRGYESKQYPPLDNWFVTHPRS